jgi:hypothetical protein
MVKFNTASRVAIDFGGPVLGAGATGVPYERRVSIGFRPLPGQPPVRRNAEPAASKRCVRTWLIQGKTQ